MTHRRISHKICSIDGCGRVQRGRGWCGTHYQRWRRHGKLGTAKIINRGEGATAAQRFWSRVNKAGNIHPYIATLGNCWLWTGHLDTKGYGKVRLDDRPQQTHRAAWFFTYGYYPALQLLHSCDNPKCCNPNHLREGTMADNMRDKLERGRQAKGSQHGRAKLTEQDVIAIRFDNRIHRVIADEYRVDRATIGRVKRWKIWTHIPCE